MAIPFDPKELKVVREAPSFFGPPTPIYDFPVSLKEGYIATMKKEPIWAVTGIESGMTTPKINPDNVARGFAFESTPLDPAEFGGKDMFGIEWVYVPVVGGSIVKPGKPTLEDANDWEKILNFPDIDSWDWETAGKNNADFVAGKKDVYFQGMILNGYFERLISFMDFDSAAIAMIDDDQKDAVKAIFGELTKTYIKLIDKYIEYFHIDGINLHDDWGAQRAPFFSCATAVEMISPEFKKIADHLHERGMFFDMHSCGQIELMVPAMIAGGFDSWGGQNMNDYAKLYDQYGDQIILGVIPDALPENCDEETARNYARAFAKKYCSNPKAPVTVSMYGAATLGNPYYREELYKCSRILYGGKTL